ncbi:MAG TPA: condensation domain-containing protein [Pseudonocardiaceae bacterium]|jgi:hypothetical protein|nr:condensation domain-containing protein [Pseudonocardiaceae bacterium]
MVERILVPFDGDGSGVEDLTWGQIGLWQSTLDDGLSRTTGGITPLPPGTTVEALADTLRFTVSRHQSLRTRLVFDEDSEARQSCSASGELPLEIYDAVDREPAELATEVETLYQTTNFDYEHEWPIRTAGIRVGDHVVYMIATYHHLMIDADGMQALFADLAARDPETGAPAGPVTGIPPLEQARQQRTPAARRQSAASMRHLEKVFRTMSISRFGEPRKDGGPDCRQLRYRSPATHLAVRAAANKLGANTSAILLATFAVGLARFTGRSPVMAWLLVNNRFRTGFAESVSALVQMSPFLIDVTEATLAETINRAQGGAMRAYKNAYYDPYLQDETIARVVEERGGVIDRSCYYNDRRSAERDFTDEPVADAEQITAAVAQAELTWPNEPAMPQQKMYCHIDDVPGAIDFTISSDLRYFTEEEMVTIVRGMESVAIEIALDPAAAAVSEHHH